MENVSLYIPGHVEYDNKAAASAPTSDEMTKEDFRKIKEGDTIFFGEEEHGKVHLTLTDSVAILDAKSQKQIYRTDLRKPYYTSPTIKHTQSLEAQVIPPAHKPKPKVKNPETVKLEALLTKFPENKDFIMDQALTGNFTVDELEAEVLMKAASEKPSFHKNTKTQWL